MAIGLDFGEYIVAFLSLDNVWAVSSAYSGALHASLDLINLCIILASLGLATR